MVRATASICVYGVLALAVFSLTGCVDCTLADVCGYSETLQGVGSSTSGCKSFKTMTEGTCATPDLPTLEAHVRAAEQDC